MIPTIPIRNETYQNAEGVGCNRIAVIELRLENYQIIRACGMCETAVRRRY